MKMFLTILMTVGMMLGSPAKASALPELKLTKDNTAVLFGVVDSASVSDVMQQIQKLDSSLKSGYPINLVLYTPGGSIQDGLELIEYLKSVNRPINTLTIFAASMGFQIAQNLKTRYILENGILMSHKARGGFDGEFGDGASQMDSRYALWMDRILDMDKTTVSKTKGKQTLKSYRAAYQNEMWLTGAKSVAGGYADEVVSATCDKSLSGLRSQSFEFFGMKITVNYSECPLNTNPISIEVEVPTNKGTMKYADFLAKGGVFIKDHKEIAGANGYFESPALYCTDPSLTMSEIRKRMDDAKKEVVARQRQVVKGY